MGDIFLQMKPQLFTAAGLARYLGFVSRSKIQAMKRAGLVFSHGRLTDVETVMDWMKKNPGFSTSKDYRPPVVGKLPQSSMTEVQPLSFAGKCDE